MAKEKLVKKKQPIDGNKKPYAEPRFWRFGSLCELTKGGAGSGENSPPGGGNQWVPPQKGHS